MAPPTGEYYKTPLGNITMIPSKKTMMPQESDMLNAGASATLNFYPFTPAAISTGTYAAIADEADHPGIARISGATNTGASITLGGLTTVLIGGSEVAEFIVRWKLIANTAIRIGFFDSITTGAPVDTVYFLHSGGTVNGRCRSNSAETATATSYTPVVDTWYRLKLEVNAAASLVTFSIYDCVTGALLWSDTVASNIPTAAGRETGFGVLAYKTTAGTVALVDVDYMAYYNEKVLTR